MESSSVERGARRICYRRGVGRIFVSRSLRPGLSADRVPTGLCPDFRFFFFFFFSIRERKRGRCMDPIVQFENTPEQNVRFNIPKLQFSCGDE